ncbi:MAG: YkgJ family cysteine cluster protein [Thermoplasmata archaeon]
MAAHRRDVAPAVEVDLSLLSGFEFACLPGCGLCCFTSPRLDPEDAARLESVAPDALLVDAGSERRLAARPEGGACQFLTDLRCGIHLARPAPCREFPISVHVGTGLQATVVLSCPGLELKPLISYSSGAASGSFSGLDSELASLRRRLTPQVERRRTEAERRRRRIARELTEQGRWLEEDEVRQQLRGRRLVPRADEYSFSDPPGVEEGLEFLPMYYDGRAGPVALGNGLGGWEALELSAVGGSRSLGLGVPPDRPPDLEPTAEELLSSYLGYWLARDGFLAAVQLEMLSTPDGSVLDAVLDDLHAIGSDVLARGAVRAKLRGRDGLRLTSDEIALGIRATDQDWLDRPTWGSRL